MKFNLVNEGLYGEATKKTKKKKTDMYVLE